MATCPSCGTENPDGRSSAGSAARRSVRSRASRRRGTQGRHRALLRPGRVHRHLGVGRPRGRGQDARRLLRDGPRPDRGPRRRGGEVHRGCRRRGLRGPRRPRGRPRARGACGPSDRRGRRGARGRRRGPLKLRVGINTGEALVRLGIAPGSGEGFLAGDAINTASRIQSVAPEMGVAVGLGDLRGHRDRSSTTRSSNPRRSRASPSRCGSSTRRHPLARFGTDLTRTHDTPFIGREIDLALLKGIFDKTVAATSPQLVTVVGEPGLGKSRIVAELGAYIDTKPDLITWRQGRCLPYGEGITFWALGEILKAHAGILESDAPDVATDQARRGPSRRRGTPLVPPAAAPAARDRGDLLRRARGAVHRVATVPRAHRRAGPDRARVRGPALGRRGDARVPGAPGRPGRGRAAA